MNKSTVIVVIIVILIIALIVSERYKEKKEKEAKENFIEYNSEENAINYRKHNATFGDPFIMKRRQGEILEIDKQFDNLNIYENDYDLETGYTGYEKCLDDSVENGQRCVEYGLTGAAIGYLPVEFKPKNFKDGITAPNETQLSYPDL